MSKNEKAFVIDLNRITKREFHAYLAGRDQAENKDLYDAENLYVKVIMIWPFPGKISVESYLDLGLEDAIKVDDAVSEALIQLTQKKSGLPLS
jgi:hypothetical protein